MKVSNFQASFPPLFFLLAVLTVAANIVNVPNMLNMVTYLHGTMHMGVSSSATTVTNVLGATSGFALIGFSSLILTSLGQELYFSLVHWSFWYSLVYSLQEIFMFFCYR